MSGLEKTKETNDRLQSEVSVDLQRQLYEKENVANKGKKTIQEKEINSNKSIKEHLNIKDVATGSKTHDAGEVKDEEEKIILDQLKEEMNSLKNQLNALVRKQLLVKGTLQKTKQQATDFNDIKQLKKMQNSQKSMVGDISHIGARLKYISSQCFHYSAEGIIIDDPKVDPTTKAVQDKCLSLMLLFKECARRLVADNKSINRIINKITNRPITEKKEHLGLDLLYGEE